MGQISRHLKIPYTNPALSYLIQSVYLFNLSQCQNIMYLHCEIGLVFVIVGRWVLSSNEGSLMTPGVKSEEQSRCQLLFATAHSPLMEHQVNKNNHHTHCQWKPGNDFSNSKKSMTMVHNLLLQKWVLSYCYSGQDCVEGNGQRPIVFCVFDWMFFLIWCKLLDWNVLSRLSPIKQNYTLDLWN